MSLDINLLPRHERVAATVDERSWRRWWAAAHLLPVALFMLVMAGLVAGLYRVSDAPRLLTETRALEVLAASATWCWGECGVPGGDDMVSVADIDTLYEIAVLHPRLAEQASEAIARMNSPSAAWVLTRLCIERSISCEWLVARLSRMDAVRIELVLQWLSAYPELLKSGAPDLATKLGDGALDELEGLAFDLSQPMVTRRAALIVVGSLQAVRSVPILRAGLYARDLRDVSIVSLASYPPELSGPALLAAVESCPLGWGPRDVEIGFRDPVAALLVRIGIERAEPSHADLRRLGEAARCGNGDAVAVLAAHPSAAAGRELERLGDMDITVPEGSLLVPFSYVVERARELRTSLGYDVVARPSAQPEGDGAGVLDARDAP